MGNIQNIAKPATITPAFNPMVFSFSGDNSNSTGYRYIAQIYSANTSNLIAGFNITPNSDGNGYIDISRVIGNEISYNFEPTNFYNYIANNSYIDYDLKIGYEIQDTSLFSFFYKQTTGIFNNYTIISGTTAFPYNVGDKINLTPTPNLTGLTGNIFGLHTVLQILNSYNFVIDALYPSNPSAYILTGSITYSDQRKTRYGGLLNYTDYTAFNGSKSFKDFLTYDKNEYIITGTSITNKALSNIPDNFNITPDQDIWLNFYTNKSSTPAFIYFKNSNNDIFRRSFLPITSSKINAIYVAGNQLDTVNLLISGTTGLIKSDTTYYDTWITNVSGQQMTKKYRFNIDQRCKIEDYEIIFMDRMGSMVSFAFPLRAQESGTITRSEFKNQIGSISNGQWTYNTYDQSSTPLNIDVEKRLTLNTNWITDEMSVYFEELLTSPYTWIKIDGTYYQCNIIDNSFVTERQKNKNLIRKTVIVKLSSETIVNL